MPEQPDRVAQRPMPEQPDRVALRRWLSAVGLVDTAEALSARASDAESLIVSQASAETALGLIAGWAPDPLPEQPKWDRLIAGVRAALQQAGSDFPPGLVSQLNASHTLRNAVVHRGAVVPPNEAWAAITATRRLLDLIPEVAQAFNVLPKNAGLAGAVAELLDAPDVQEQLRAAEAAVRSERPTEAADAAGRALSMALARAEPRLGGPNSAVDIGFMRFPREGHDRELLGVLKRTDERLSDVEEWVLGAVLGVRPVDMARLRGITGRRIVFIGGTDSIHRSRDPTLAEATWALRQVAEVIYRLQETGALIEGSADEVWKRRRAFQTTD